MFNRRLVAVSLLAGLVLAVGAAGPAHPAGVLAAAAPKPWQPPAGSTPAKPAIEYLSDTTALIRIDGVPVRADEIVWTYFDGFRANLPGTDRDGRLKYLQTFVDQRVLGLLAHEVNPPLDFTARAELRENEERVLSNELFLRRVQDSVHVDTSEVRVMWNLAAVQRRLRMMSFVDRATAERVRAALVTHRMTWAQAYLTAHRGIHRPDQGDLGWLSPLDDTDYLPSLVHRLKDGEYSPLWQDVGGWNLVQCVESRAMIRPGSYRASFQRYKIVLEHHRAIEISDRMQATIRARVHAVYDTANVVWMADNFDAVNPRTDQTILKIGVHSPQIAPDDTSRVMARYDGGVLSANGFMRAYTATPPMVRQLLNTAERVRRQVDAAVFEPTFAQYAREQGLDRDSAVVVQLARKHEELLVERIYADSVEAHIKTDPATVRRYYNDHLPDFITYPNVKYVSFVRPTKSAADSLAARLRSGLTVEKAIAADTLPGQKRAQVRTMTQQDEGETFYMLLFEELKPGEVSVQGPDEKNQYAVVKLITFDSGRQLSFEEAAGYAEDAIRGQQAEELLQGLLARQRARHQIVVYEDRVMNVRWEDPTLPQR